MKTLKLLVLALLATSFTASAQLSAVRKTFEASRSKRTDIILPQVKGYNVYKADLHTHTIYSDGDITPAMRVWEAYRDGLDIISITDHMEYRRTEREIYRYMKDYIRPELRGEKRAINTNVLNTDPDSRGLLVDFNVGYENAIKEAKKWGVMVIRGVEITRGKLGDYNALFTTDNNALYDPNLEQTIRNARKQGAFIIHNHPQYSKHTKSTMPEHCEDFYRKGLIDGIEVANSNRMWDRLITYCIDGGFAPMSNSDVHYLVSDRYPDSGTEYFRNMTFILAKKCDEKSIKEALNAKRTIAYHANMLVGKIDLLQAFFKACVKVESLGVCDKNQRVRITNNSSIPFALRWDGRREAVVYGMSSAVINVNQHSNDLELEILNMLYENKKSPKVMFKLR